MLQRYKSLTHSVVGLANAGRTHARLRDSLASKKIQDELVKLAHQASEHQLAVGVLSSASVRLKGDKFLITSRHAWFGDLKPDDLAIGSLQSSPIVQEQALPDAATWHQFVYAHTSAQWALLTQPAGVMALAYRGQSLQPAALPAAAQLTGEVALHTASDAPTDALAAHVQARCALIIGHLGLLVWSATSREVLSISHLLARWAEIMLKSETAEAESS
jgi:ribulose-5-phosphate 4-epimerase/fuculose-1-phosphate aldolase